MRINRTITTLFILFALSLSAVGQQATNIKFNTIPNDSEGKPIHRTATIRYESVSVNGIEIPVVDGLNPNKDKDRLDYDFTTFSATSGRATIRIKCKNKIGSIAVSPIKLNIPLTKIDDYTYEFDVPDPTSIEPFYLIATVNGNRLAIARDLEETDVPALGTSGIFNVADELTSVSIDARLMNKSKDVAKAFQAAMDKASDFGTANNTRGVVYVPAGLYYMANLWIKSNTSLYLAPGSVVRFTDNKEDYSDDYIKTSLDSDDPVGRHGTWWICTKEGAKNIKIYGRGTLDGNGYYLQKKAAKNRKFCNNLLMIMQASDVTVDGIVLFQGAFWGTIVARSNDVLFTNAKFFQSMDGNENDGIDVCESQNVIVDRAIGMALDDPFSTKTWAGTGMMINWFGQPEQLDNVTFNNCISYTYCGAFKMGHGAMQKQKNVLVQNGVVVNSGRAIGIEPVYGNPNGLPVGGYEDVTFDNIDIEHSSDEGWLKILTDRPNVGTPPAKNIVIKNINIRNRGNAGALLGFDDENMIDGITFDNITLFNNTKPVSSLAAYNVTKKGFYKNLKFVQDYSRDVDYLIEGEYFNGSKTVAVKENAGTDAEYPKGMILTGLTNGSYLRYNDVDFGSNTNKIEVRTNILLDGTIIEFRLNNPTSGTLVGSKTLAKDGRGVWSTQEIDLDSASGIHDLYVVFVHPTAGTLSLAGLNFFELKERTFIDLVSIAPSKSPMNINVDESVSLEIAYLPENAYQRDVEWTLMNESEVGVIGLSKEGVIKGLKEGVATVKATSTFDDAITATFTINVIDIYVKDILRVEAESADAIFDTYHYDNAISVGLVKDPADPTANGILNCWNTNFAVYKGIDFAENTIKATIRKGYPRGSKIELWIDRTIDEVAKTATGGTLIGSIEFPAAASDWSRWQTFETEISGASGVHDLCLVFLAGGGSATNQNYGALNWIEFTRVIETISGINENKQALVQVYPNPFAEDITISANSDIQSIVVTDMLGKIVYNRSQINSSDHRVVANQWGKGIYLVQIKTQSRIESCKVIKL